MIPDEHAEVVDADGRQTAPAPTDAPQDSEALAAHTTAEELPAGDDPVLDPDQDARELPGNGPRFDPASDPSDLASIPEVVPEAVPEPSPLDEDDSPPIAGDAALDPPDDGDTGAVEDVAEAEAEQDAPDNGDAVTS